MRLRILARDTEVVLLDVLLSSFNLTRGINQSDEWSTSIPSDTPGIENLNQGDLIEFYYKDELYFEGTIQSYDAALTDSSDFSLSGRSLLDQLYAKRSYPLSFYSNAPLLGVLTELFLDTDWNLGYIGTLVNPDITVSQDVRAERNLLTQISKIIESLSYTYWRQGANNTIEVGLFNEYSYVNLLPAHGENVFQEDLTTHTLTKLNYTIHFPDAAYGIQALGGPVRTSSVDRAVNLGDAVSYDWDYLYDTDWPLVENLNDQSWILIHGLNYPYPGGTIISAETKVTTALYQLGDRDGAGVERRSLLITFIPFAGRMEYFNVWIGSKLNNFAANWTAGDFNIVWDLWQVDSATLTTLQGTALHTQIIDFLPEDNSILRIIPDTEIILEAGIAYGIVLYLDAQPSSGLASMQILAGDRAPIANSVLRLLVAASGAPTNGKVYSVPRVPIFQLVTSPLTEISANITTEQQEQLAPPRDGTDASAAAVANAGNALREFAKAYLIEHPELKKEYSASVIGSEVVPKVGDTVRVQGKAYANFFSDEEGKLVSNLVEEVDRELRVTQYQMTFNATDEITINYTLTDGEGVPYAEQLLGLYQETRRRRRRDGKQYERPWGLVLDTININVAAVSPNDAFDDGRLAYRVTTDIFQGSFVALPASTEGVYLAGTPFGTSNDGILRIEVLTEPEFVASSPIVFRVGFTTRDWQFGDSADLVVKLVWR